MIQPSVLRRQAGDLLQKATYNPKKLVLIHTAISTGSLLLVNVLSYLFSLLIDRTGGLSGMGLRSVLATIQSVLEFGAMLALPFWEIGLLFAALGWAKGESSTPTDLLEGFRRLGSVLGLRLLQGVLFFLVGIAIFNISYMIFLISPFADPFLSQLEPVYQFGLSAQPEEVITEELLMAVAKSCVPLFIIFGALYAVAAIALFYRIRFADFALMEGSGALKVMLESARITKKRFLQLLKLDLSFWWFYLLQVLCIAIGYGDSILPALGISLPLSPAVQFFLFSTLSLLSQGVLIWQYQGVVLTTYSLAYQTLAAPTSPPQPTNVPRDL